MNVSDSSSGLETFTFDMFEGSSKHRCRNVCAILAFRPSTFNQITKTSWRLALSDGDSPPPRLRLAKSNDWMVLVIESMSEGV